MIDHFEIKTLHYERCLEFYSIVLLPLGIELKWSDEAAAGFGIVDEEKVRFLIEKSDNHTASHIAFTATDRNSVQRFYESGVRNGFHGNGKPGVREHYAPNYYAAFLLDPDGNNVEAVVYLQGYKNLQAYKKAFDQTEQLVRSFNVADQIYVMITVCHRYRAL